LALAQAITDPAELLTLLGLGVEWRAPAEAAAREFPLRVPRGFVARMRRGDPSDPLLRQVLPLGDELSPAPGFGPDPVGDRAARRGSGVFHKYSGRVLLTATGACAVHCRYCFRRHFPYDEENAAAGHWRSAVDYVRSDPTIDEIILSGGDPLTLSDRRLEEFVAAAAEVPSLRRLRIHSRLPVVLPERVSAELIRVLTHGRLGTVVVIHANHPQEIDSAVGEACRRLGGAGITVLNQSVLLRGVNDQADILVDLSRSLYAAGVLPYYLHMLDRVAGAAHFEVTELRALELLMALKGRLPGYLVPRLVREIAGRDHKTLL
jgi:EF-P beta-lysylation protein EpmB